ncbi:hypothetical protein BGZ94_003222 [Podila epigama]|nr:hypothetical protein BGZ94_003222 [Podila epigama]
MARFTSIFIACAIAMVASSVAAQDPIPASTSCVIATPQSDLKQGKAYKVTFTGCQGTGNIQLRHGSPTNLDTESVPACANINFASGSCTFKPTKAGTYSMSAIDASNVETFTNVFNVKPAPKPAVAPSKKISSKEAAAKAETKPKTPSSASKAESVRRANTKRALYDIAAFAL